MAESLGFRALKELYFALDKNFNKLFDACETDEQKDMLRQQYVNARDNFWEARNRVFISNDPQVKELISELQEATATIQELLEELEEIAKVLDLIKGAVCLGSSLVTMGSM